MYCIFFFKQKTAYEMRISDWSSDVCSSDLALEIGERRVEHAAPCARAFLRPDHFTQAFVPARGARQPEHQFTALHQCDLHRENRIAAHKSLGPVNWIDQPEVFRVRMILAGRSEERREGEECVSRCRSRW